MISWIKHHWFEISLGIAGIFVVILGIGGVFLGAHLGPAEGRALIGDFVGGTTTPILTALTFIGVLVGIALQRRELIATRKELERSAEALENQGAHLEKQQLSQSFFDLFEMYKSVVDSIEHGTGDTKKNGKAALERFAGQFSPYSMYSTEPWRIDNVLDTHKEQNSQLGNYYRIVYCLLRFLSEQDQDGAFFADMFRAQLTTRELHLLFFNCISEVGSPLQPLAARFELFDNMPVPNEQGFEEIVKLVDPVSFGKNLILAELSLVETGSYDPLTRL